MIDDQEFISMLSRIDERTKLMAPQLEDIFDRLRILEQKGQTCKNHAAMVEDINNLKTENKITSIIFGCCASFFVLLVGWLTRIIRFN